MSTPLYAGGMPDRCGRPTLAGTPCRLPPELVTARNSGQSFKGAACYHHLTAEEWAALRAAQDAISQDDWCQDLAHHQSLPDPACWSWLVSKDDRGRAAEASECPDPARACELARALLSDWQRGRCAVCGGIADRLDHDHESLLVRGMLCCSCNNSEHSDYTPGGRFDRYRRWNPAIALGLTVRYYSPFMDWATPPERLRKRPTSEAAIATLEALEWPDLPEVKI